MLPFLQKYRLGKKPTDYKSYSVRLKKTKVLVVIPRRSQIVGKDMSPMGFHCGRCLEHKQAQEGERNTR